MNAVEVFEQARDLIENPERWTTGALAIIHSDHDVTRTYPTDPDAMCWCVEGAVCKVLGADRFTDGAFIDTAGVLGWEVFETIVREAYEMLDELGESRVEPTAAPYKVNDDHGHPAALDLLQRCVESAKDGVGL